MNKHQKIEVPKANSDVIAQEVQSQNTLRAQRLNPTQSVQRLSVYLDEKARTISRMQKPGPGRELDRYTVAKNSIDERLTLARSLA